MSEPTPSIDELEKKLADLQLKNEQLAHGLLSHSKLSPLTPLQDYIAEVLSYVNSLDRQPSQYEINHLYHLRNVAYQNSNEIFNRFVQESAPKRRA